MVQSHFNAKPNKSCVFIRHIYLPFVLCLANNPPMLCHTCIKCDPSLTYNPRMLFVMIVYSFMSYHASFIFLTPSYKENANSLPPFPY